MQGKVDAATGAIGGPVADIAQELARRLGVPFKVTPSAGVRDVLDAVKGHMADVGLLAFDATRAAEVDFTRPYALAYNFYIVLEGSPIQTVADADRPGVRIASQKGDSGDLFLGRELKRAQLSSIAGLNPEQAQKMLVAHEIDAYATNRQRLTEMAARFPGLRLVRDNFFGVEQSLVVSKGDSSRVDYLNTFLDGLGASGFLQTVIDRAKLSGATVAPAR